MINQIYPSIYLGDSSVQRIYSGDDLIYINGTPDILCEYIANGPDTDNSIKSVYFNTGVVPDVSTKVEISCAAAIIDKGVNVPIFSGIDNSWNGLTICMPRFTGTVAAVVGNAYAGGPSIVSNTKYTVTAYQSSSTQADVIVNGTAYSNSTTSATVTAPAYLFAYNKNGTVNTTGSYSGLKIYYLKFWDDNNLIRFYIPVLHYINGQYTPCFYDKVNDTYIYNLGTDAPTYKIQGDYLLDYLGAPPEQSIPNTTSYIMRYDSDVVADTSLATDVKFRLVYGRENFIFGSGTSGQTTPTWQQYSLLCPGNLYRVNFNSGSREEGAISAGLITDSSAVYDVHTLSTYFEEGKSRIYLDDSFVWQTTFVSSYISSNTIHLFSRHGDASNSNAGAGSRIYYINFTKSNVPSKSYVPVFHNNQAAFLDLNSGTYIYNIGTDVPYYQFKR